MSLLHDLTLDQVSKNSNREHLYRKHTVYLCNRCKEKFKSEEEVVKHQLKKEICTVASDRIGTDGVTPEISARLRHRGALSGLSDVDKWYAIWDILFPDVTRPFIPCKKIQIPFELQN